MGQSERKIHEIHRDQRTGLYEASRFQLCPGEMYQDGCVPTEKNDYIP